MWQSDFAVGGIVGKTTEQMHGDRNMVYRLAHVFAEGNCAATAVSEASKVTGTFFVIVLLEY